MGKRPLRRTSDINYQVDSNRRRVERLERRRLAGRWWEPDCTLDPYGITCTGLEPALENGWAQPSSPLERFAFRLHADGSLEFKGHLDSAGASSGTVAFTLPGANIPDEIDFRPPNDQFFLTVVYDGANPQGAMVYIDSTTGEVTITFPI